MNNILEIPPLKSGFTAFLGLGLAYLTYSLIKNENKLLQRKMELQNRLESSSNSHYYNYFVDIKTSL